MISLLNCLGKVAEKIIATRLSFLAKLTDLLDPDQIDGRRQNSAIDAILSLVYDIQLVKYEKRVTFMLLMDIKGAFNHVSANQMLRICQKLQLLKSLYYWVKSFLQDRKVQLKFNENN